uniref:Putative secreted protein n=1 Tax=Ixodes ricinus TaxID=34613 RepID=V5HBD9_IXORI
MGLTGTALVLVSLAIFGSAAAHGCQKRNANPHRKKEREGCDFYCWNTVTNSWDKFSSRTENNAFTTNGGRGTM